jgi:hypothetical protein
MLDACKWRPIEVDREDFSLEAFFDTNIDAMNSPLAEAVPEKDFREDPIKCREHPPRAPVQRIDFGLGRFLWVNRSQNPNDT